MPIFKGFYLFPRIIVLLLGLYCGSAFAEERITHFASDILIRADRSLLVTETIAVVAENAAIRHGIYREFPTVYPHPVLGSLGFKEKTGFSIIYIKLDGVDAPWELKHINNGVRFYIGDPDAYVSRGPHVYEIQYVTTRQISHRGSVDRLNWNVNGQGWTFPSEHVSAVIRLQSGETISDYTAWTGAAESQEVAYDVEQGKADSVLFSTTRPLRPFEGLTISLTLPEGLLTAPASGAYRFLKDNVKWIIALLLLLSMPIYYLHAWSRVGRDPQKGVVIADYHPVRGMSAAAHHFILNNKVNNDTFTAAILSIAIKGYIRIEQKTSKTYRIHKLAGPAETSVKTALSHGEEIVLKYLFFDNKTTVELGGEYSRWIATGKRKLGSYLKTEWREAIYKQNHRYTWTGLLIGLLALLFGELHLSNTEIGLRNLLALSVFFIAAIALTRNRLRPFVFGAIGLLFFYALNNINFSTFDAPAMIFLSLVVAILFAIFYFLLKAPTPFGRKILDEIEGFRLYLVTAEQHRLNILHPPQKTPELFERLLPYAIALGVENHWSEQFAEVFKQMDTKDPDYSPSWYEGLGNTRFNSNSIASGLGSGLSNSVASASTAPSSRSSGGMSGGGAGSGGGGGGGGGW